ncbi:MAG: carboxypeptidase regulatory-like domain-containing protein [Gammaproteobacteria bacterium]|nr:carboxypeptidase regulatory-like domain-containing protein [Gammaproteobacteria bacterium]
MNRLRLLVAAALLGLPLVACEEGTQPPPVGEIDGRVVVEGEGLDGVTVSLSSGAATTTSGGGYFSFKDVEGGTYTITISGYPGDASFDQTTAEATITQADQTVNRNFNGSWIRTASLMGMVTVEGGGLPGVTVAITGRQDAQMLTDGNGQYTFTGLRAGNYTVTISGFDATDVAFSATSNALEVAVGESKVWSFDGTYVRESTIAGQVSVEGNGLAGVTISLQGMGADESENTDMGGQFTFSNLRAGEYQLAISGFDTREYGFSTTSATVRVEHGRTANVPFEGIMLRTASIMGQVSIEGEGLADVTVSLSGEGESLTTMTDNSGQYAFSKLPAGNFQVGISGYDTDDYSFETTSKNVALALGETATVPFEGILLRTSGISGRVSVEGMGLDSVTVTLSGDDLEEDMTSMTDASGQYAIAGLAEGDYTVAISDYDAVAYVFETTSMEVTLGDDDTQIVNFMGMHARTASISGKVYVDEAGKNDAYDDGENALMAPGISLALVGPGILDRTLGATGPDGSFSFGELRAGPYQLVVANAAAAGPDHAYGGPAEGYGFNLGVGDEETQNIPFDITHTTVNFSVNLKSGAAMGDALPGATVSFFSDMAGEQKIGDSKTGDDGMASMRIARSAASNHTVYASVAAPAGDYDTDGAMQAVMWDAQMTMHAASNSSDIVNLKADFSFNGATITTDFGGGMALGGWAISVSSDKSAAVDTPDKLDAMGDAKYSEVVMADSLPVKYTVAVAADQANTLDGGEKYSAGDGLEYTHDGLSLPATMDAGTLEVKYTTQTLKVYVHNERDQIMGFTGNVLGGDARMSGVLDIAIRHIERSSGRSRAFPTTAKVRASSKDGVYTFSNVPADAQVIVQADVKAGQNVKLLGEDELDAYTDNADNGRMKGAFGDNGGYNHTVELCPLMSRAEDQRHGECSSFAFVNTYAVHGQVWENTVATDGAAGGFRAVAKTAFKGVVVSMDPVDGENLAGDADSYTSGTDDKTTKNFNEAMFFDWDRKASGEYKLSVSAGWVAKVGGPDDAVPFGNQVSPLGADLQIDVSPTTGYVYGTVTDQKGFRVEGATVSANSATGTTDAFGRYRIRGFSGATVAKQPNKVAMTVSKAGFAQGKMTIDFAANAPAKQDFELSGEAKTATVSGTVRSSGSGDPVAGVTITVNGGRPVGATKDLKTGTDGTYTALVPVGNVVIAPSKAGMSFSPERHETTTIEGGAVSGLDFTGYPHGTLTGRVLSTSGGPMSGAKVTATPASGGAVADSSRTDVRGVYSLSVPFGRYTVAVEADGYTFATEDGDASVSVNVASGGTESVEDFKATAVATPPSTDVTLSALSVNGAAVDAGDDGNYATDVTNDVAMATIEATATDANATVAYAGADADSVMAGHQVALTAGMANAETVTVTAEDGTTTADYTVTVNRAAAVVTLSASPNPVDEGGKVTVTASLDVAQAEAFTVTVSATGGTLGDNELSFAAGATTSTGDVTITQTGNDVRDTTPLTVVVSGSTTASGVADIEDVTVNVTDDELVATMPRNLAAMPGDQSATVTWDPPSQFGSAAITSYEWEATAAGQARRFGTITDLTALTIALGDGSDNNAALMNGVTYTISVHAVTSIGDGDPAITTVKAQPNLTMVASQASITEAGEDSSEVVVSLSNPTSEAVTVTVTLDDSNLASLSKASMLIEVGTTADTTYVKAKDNRHAAADTVMVTATADNANDPAAGIEIEITNDTDAAPGEPRGLLVTPGNAQLKVEWNSPESNGTQPITRYEIRWAVSDIDEEDWEPVDGDAGAREYTITGLTNGTTYTVQVRAVSDAGGGSAASGEGSPSSSE